MFHLKLANDSPFPLIGIYPRELKTYFYTDLYINIDSSITHSNENILTTYISSNSEQTEHGISKQ